MRAGDRGAAPAADRRRRAQISIDTSKAAVARAALAAGATLVNDVSALRADPEMAGWWPTAGSECCLMHMLGEPRTMQREPRYGDVVDEVKAFLEERLAFAVRRGHRRGADHARPRDRLRQDGRAQPRAAAPPGRADRARPPDRDRHLAQELPGAHRRRRARPGGAARGRSPAARDDRDERARARARARASSVCTTSRRCARRWRWRLLRWAAMDGEEPRRGRGRSGRRRGCRELDEDREEAAESVTVEISGLSLYTHHGVSEAEREIGQRLVIDLRLDVGETDATVTDSIEDTVDYARGLPARGAASPSSARTGRSSGSAARSPTGCSTTTSSKACGSRPPSPSRRSR